MKNTKLAPGIAMAATALLIASAAYGGGHNRGGGSGEPAPPIDKSKEPPVRIIPNIPPAAEAYYAPDDYHLIAQTQDPDAQSAKGRADGRRADLYLH